MEFDIPEGAKLVAPTPTPIPNSNNKEGKEVGRSSSPKPAVSTKKINSSDLPNTSATLVSNVVRLQLTNGQSYEESKVFKGHVSGYVFKLGDKGLGYYKDTLYHEDEDEDDTLDEEHDDVVVAPYDFKQMNEVCDMYVYVLKKKKT
jgi:hypothetical protein